MSTPETKLAMWAVVQIMGHQMIAGHVTEEPVAGVNMLRVDVPAVGEWPAHTKYFGGGAIYSIDPCTEEIARQAAEQLANRFGYTPMPVSVPALQEARGIIDQAARAQRQLTPPARVRSPYDDDDDGGPF